MYTIDAHCASLLGSIVKKSEVDERPLNEQHITALAGADQDPIWFIVQFIYINKFTAEVCSNIFACQL
jgi:flagellar biosynthesis regulator FlbT